MLFGIIVFSILITHLLPAGRDTSIAVGGSRTAPLIYVSFLDYNGDGSAKIARLAILKPSKVETARRETLKERTRPVADALAPPPDGGKNDICKDVHYRE
eukprot:COSAG02_NODE_6840_length_3333_cov_2.140074_2_plen_100_part_00